MKTLLTLLVVAIAIPARAQAEPDLQPALPQAIVAPPSTTQPWARDDPRNYKLVPNKKLMLAGVITAAVSYGVVALGGGVYTGGFTAIPIAGPVYYGVFLASFGGAAGVGLASLVFLDSGLQIAGLTMAIVGAVTHKKVWNPPVTIAPLAAADRVGATLGFRF